MIQNTLLFMYLVYDPYSLLDGTICTNVVKYLTTANIEIRTYMQ